MKQSFKKMLCSVAALSLLMSVTACAGTPAASTPTGTTSNAGTPAAESNAAPKERIELEYWDITPEGSDGYEELEALVNGFNEVQDQYTIKHVGFPFFDYFDKMTTAFAGGVAPDVYLYTLDDVPQRASTGTALNLTPYIEKDKYDLSDLYDNEAKFGVWEGQQYALPASSTCRLLFYNLDMFEAAGLTEADVPKTWDQLKEVALKMNKATDGTIDQLGYDPINGQNQKNNQSQFFAMLWQANLDFFDKDGNPAVNTPENKAVLDYMINFNSDYSFQQLQTFRDAGSALAVDNFVSGRVAMMTAVSDEYYVLKNNEVTFRYGCAPTPMPENGKRISWSSCWSYEAFNSGKEDKQQGAWEFIKYMLEPDSQTKWYESLGWLTASRAANEKLKTDPLMTVVIDELPYASEKVYLDYAPKWHADWDQFMQKATAGTPTDQVLAEAQQFFIEKQQNYAATQK